MFLGESKKSIDVLVVEDVDQARPNAVSCSMSEYGLDFPQFLPHTSGCKGAVVQHHDLEVYQGFPHCATRINQVKNHATSNRQPATGKARHQITSHHTAEKVEGNRKLLLALAPPQTDQLGQSSSWLSVVLGLAWFA